MHENMNKEDWVSMFKEIGLSDEQMKKWHQVFEKRHPKQHQQFLEHLGISSDEIAAIRAM